MYAGEGQKVTIYCNPEAAPRPKFTWRKDDLLIGMSYLLSFEDDAFDFNVRDCGACNYTLIPE